MPFLYHANNLVNELLWFRLITANFLMSSKIARASSCLHIKQWSLNNIKLEERKPICYSDIILPKIQNL